MARARDLSGSRARAVAASVSLAGYPITGIGMLARRGMRTRERTLAVLPSGAVNVVITVTNSVRRASV